MSTLAERLGYASDAKLVILSCDDLGSCHAANVGVYDGRAGDTLSVVRPSGEDASFAISGRGRSLPGGEQVQDEDVIVLYAPAATVTALGVTNVSRAVLLAEAGPP